MKAVLYSKNGSGNVYTELFGLSRAGKTTLAKKLVAQKKFVLGPKRSSKLVTFFLFFFFCFSHPFKTVRLFKVLNTNNIRMSFLTLKKKLRIVFMRNSYLVSVLAKSVLLRSTQKNLLVDEFFLQLLFILLQNKSSEKNIRKIFSFVPLPRSILLVEETKAKRYARFRAHRFPGGHIDKEYSLIWMENQEHNYRIIKKIIAQMYSKKKLLATNVL